MKKFKTKSNIRKVKVIILIIVFLILFTIISFFKLNKSYYALTKNLLNTFSDSDTTNLRFLTSNLDRLFNSYSFYREDVVFKENKPSIYLYNTHDKERYEDNTSIIEATSMLHNNLNKLGISVIQEEQKTSDFLYTGLSYYEISRTFLENQISNKNIKYYLDIHRDTATDTKIIINNKPYAKILFVLGLDNKDYLKNKKIIRKMNDYLNNHYPGISKGIYEKKGKGVDGVYNQDLSDNVILIEIGGIKNNREEINNSTEILSLMLYNFLGD